MTPSNLTHHKYKNVSKGCLHETLLHPFIYFRTIWTHEPERLKLLCGPPALLLALLPEVLSVVGISSHLRQPPHVFGKSEDPLLRPPLECHWKS